MKFTRTSGWRVVAASMVAFLAFGGASAASAAPPYVTEATITSIDFVNDVVQSGTDAELMGTWSLPDNPSTPAGFTVALPAELQGLSDTFQLLDPLGDPMGDCVVTATEIVCDFDEAYLLAHPRNLAGSFNFWANIRTVVTETAETPYVIGGHEVTVTVTPAAGPCNTSCVFTGRDSDKSGTYDRDTETIMWVVRVASGASGAAGGEAMMVADNLGPNQTLLTSFEGKTYPQLRWTNELVTTSSTQQQPGNWTNVPTDQYTVDGGTVSWSAEAGYYYSIRYLSQVTDGGAAGTYTNEATVDVGGTREEVVSQVVRQGGGGTGVGEQVGRFSVEKDVTWEDTSIEDLEFAGTFTVTSPADVVSEGEFTVTEGATWTSGEYATGSIVHINEILPSDPGNIVWAEPIWSTNDFLITGATTTAVTLTNEATLAKGHFLASKSVEGDGAAALPDDTLFKLDYSYPAGVGFSAGAGTLELPADGTVVSSAELPVGAELTLSEQTPDAVAGATWTSATLSTSTVTIGNAEPVTVTVTNVLTNIPEEPTIPPVPTTPTVPPVEPPTTPSAPETPPLVATGGGELTGIIALAGALIAVGILSLRRSRMAEQMRRAS